MKRRRREAYQVAKERRKAAAVERAAKQRAKADAELKKMISPATKPE